MKHHRTEEEQTAFVKRRRTWTWGSALAIAVSIATIAISWPEFNNLAHWLVSQIDMPDKVNMINRNEYNTREYMKAGFDSVNSNITQLRWQVHMIEIHMNVDYSLNTGKQTNIFNQ